MDPRFLGQTVNDLKREGNIKDLKHKFPHADQLREVGQQDQEKAREQDHNRQDQNGPESREV